MTKINEFVEVVQLQGFMDIPFRSIHLFISHCMYHHFYPKQTLNSSFSTSQIVLVIMVYWYCWFMWCFMIVMLITTMTRTGTSQTKGGGCSEIFWTRKSNFTIFWRGVKFKKKIWENFLILLSKNNEIFKDWEGGITSPPPRLPGRASPDNDKPIQQSFKTCLSMVEPLQNKFIIHSFIEDSFNCISTNSLFHPVFIFYIQRRSMFHSQIDILNWYKQLNKHGTLKILILDKDEFYFIISHNIIIIICLRHSWHDWWINFFI